MKVALTFYLVGFLRLSGCTKYSGEPENVPDGVIDEEYVPSEDPIGELLEMFLSSNTQPIDTHGTVDGVELTNLHPVGLPPEPKLDLTNPHSSVTVSNSTDANGVECKKYNLGIRGDILLVVENGIEAWKAGDGEKCFYAETHSKDGCILLTLYVNGKDDRMRDKYFEKNDTSWNEITKQVHEQRLARMRGDSTETSSE